MSEIYFTRWILVITVTLLGVSAGSLRAQEQRIIFPDRTVVVEDAFKEIEKQTEILISMSRGGFNFQKKVKLSHNNLSLQQALQQLLAKTGRTYIIRGKHVLIIPEKQPVETAVVEPFTPIPEDEKDTPIIPLPIRFEELDLNQTPMDLDSLENALVLRKIEYPVEIPAEPSLHKTLYYKKRDKEGFTSGKPFYTTGLPTYALRTNLLYGFATLTPNVGVEFGIAEKSTLLTTFSYNGWNTDGTETNNDKLCHWIAQAEYRYWLCESFNGHFFGAHAFYGYYNISGKKIPLVLEKNSDQYRYKGNVMGMGLSYGYQLMLAPRWNVEFNLGFGVGRMKYDKWDCDRCGNEVDKEVSRVFFAPTKLGVSLVYIFK